jgi:hypothetical protein
MASTNSVYIFGGDIQNGGYSNELLTYHDGTWQSETDVTGPSARGLMAVATVGEVVFLFGGYGSKCQGVSLWR